MIELIDYFKSATIPELITALIIAAFVIRCLYEIITDK